MASLSIGELVGYLRVDDSEWTKGVDSAERRFGKAGETIGKVAKWTGAAILAGVGYSLATGFSRLTGIENAEAKLRGLGHSAGEVESIMDNALNAVKGTAFGMDEAASVAAATVASGVKPGKELEAVLSLVGDAAAIAGTSMGDMGDIFNKVAAKGRVGAEEMNRLTDRGIPILQMLADHYGVTAEQASEMVSAGEVDFAAFQAAMRDRVGGAALEMGNTTTGAFANMRAAAARLGAAMLSGIFPVLIKGFTDATGWIDKATDAVAPLSVAFGQALATAIPLVVSALSTLFSVLGSVVSAGLAVVGFLSEHSTVAKALGITLAVILTPALIRMGIEATIAAARTVKAWAVKRGGAIKTGVVYVATSAKVVAAYAVMAARAVVSGAVQAAQWALMAARAIAYRVVLLAVRALTVATWVGMAASAAVNAARVVASWALMGAQAMLHAGRMAAAWVVAMGPVGWVIAAVVGLVALIVANWDRVKQWTSKAWQAVSNAVAASWERSTAWVRKGFAAITRQVANFPGVRLMTRHWSRITGAFSSGISRARSITSAGISAVIAGFNRVASIPGRVVGWFRSMRDGARSQLSSLVETVRGLPRRIIDGLSSLPGSMLNIGKDIVRGIWNGIKAMGGWIKDKVKGFAGGLVKGFTGALGINSPSRVMARRVGRHLPTGLVMGISQTASKAVRGAANLAKRVADGAANALGTPVGGPQLAGVPAVGGRATRRPQHELGGTSAPGRDAPLIGTVVQRNGDSADDLAERIWFKTRKRG